MSQGIHPPEYQHGYMSLLLEASAHERRRILIGVPMTGLIRAEWALARYGQVLPTNWSASEHIQWMNQLTPLNYSVADARNVIVHNAVTAGFEWLFFIDSDVILPPDCFIKLNAYMRTGDIPVINGLYFAKAHPPEPLIYRGRGNSYYPDFELGDKVWVDGISMGCTLIHVSLLKAMWDEAPEYTAGGNQSVRRVFDTPQITWTDPEMAGMRTFQGTEDLAWCDRVMQGNFLKKAGWDAIAEQEYPFLSDTGIFCHHITPDGRRFPLEFKW